MQIYEIFTDLKRENKTCTLCLCAVFSMQERKLAGLNEQYICCGFHKYILKNMLCLLRIVCE